MAAASGEAESVSNAKRFDNRTTRWLRRLDFGFIRTRFFAMQGNKKLHKRANVILYLLPLVVSIGFGSMHVATQSFKIYLKYQAMVDAYYYQEIMKPKEVLVEANEHIQAAEVPQEEA